MIWRPLSVSAVLMSAMMSALFFFTRHKVVLFVCKLIVQNQSQEDISELMVDLFGGKSLSSLRHINFTQKWLVQKHLLPLKGLPTSPATTFHSLCVYYKIMVWTGMANDMNTTDWGWKEESRQLIPVMFSWIHILSLHLPTLWTSLYRSMWSTSN